LGAGYRPDSLKPLLNAPDVSTKKGLRDRAMLAVLLGCGLRRSEVAPLTFKHIQQRDNRWCIVDLVGKHGRVRTIPIPTWVSRGQRPPRVERWLETMVLPTEDSNCSSRRRLRCAEEDLLRRPLQVVVYLWQKAPSRADPNGQDQPPHWLEQSHRRLRPRILLIASPR
jgi:integrase